MKNSTIDWDFLKTKLQYNGRWQPMYNSDFHRFLESAPLIPKPYKSDLRGEFLDCIHSWITGTELNKLTGLDAFPDRDFIQGVTQQIDDLVVSHGHKLCVLEKEFHYSKTISDKTRTISPSELEQGDHLLISLPFSNSGNCHPDLKALLDKAIEVGAAVHIDCAWMGCCRGIEFDFDIACIESVSFSLSKSLGLGAHRSGVRYTRTRPRGIVTTQNDQNYLLDSPLWIGILAMKEFGVDYLQKRYYQSYKEVCQRFHLSETNTIFVAIDPSLDWVQGVGLRPVIRYLDEEKW